MSHSPEHPPIPREFHSEYEDRPLRACSHCGEPLAAFGQYQINKAWRNGECVFEYVFCEACRDRMIRGRWWVDSQRKTYVARIPEFCTNRSS